MTTKRPSKKQVIISMNTKNRNCFMKELSAHVYNINRALKNIKSEIIADFIHLDNKGIIITTNKVVAPSDLNMVEKYIKDLNDIDSSNVPKLPQLKSYFKIFQIFHTLWKILIFLLYLTL